MLYDDKKFIGNVIKSARKNKGLTQAELAEKVCLCEKNIGNIENGKQFPQVNNFLRIIEFLNLTLKDFGAGQITNNKDDLKDELLKIVLSSSSEQCKKYLKIIKCINEIIE